MAEPKSSVPKISAGGLVTVAFLKARLDEGSDHLGIFMPLVLDVVAHLQALNFTTAEVQEALATSHGVAMPEDTVATLLKRATRKGYLLREAGRYRRNPTHDLPASNVAGEKAAIEQGQARLGEALRVHAAKRELSFSSSEAALDALLAFLEKEQVALLLGGTPEAAAGRNVGTRSRGIIAEFIHDAIRDDPALLSVLRGLLEGLVLYHAAFLPDLAESSRSFRDLRVIFDSVLVRQALGYEGQAARGLMRGTLDLLKASNVQCLVFDKTVHEIQRILEMYEHKLGTPNGRASLRPVPMARHFLMQHYSRGDIRELAALLERDMVAAGFQILAAPRRVAEFTGNEKALAKRLTDPVTQDEQEPRVVHDVDSVAGVLMLRRGRRSATVEDVGVVFATASSLVIRNTRAWWEEDEHETGVPPIVHIRALASLAWLKKPSLCSDFKMRELVALCAAALRPASETWRRFLRHLESLRTSHRLDSDEAAAIVVSAMSDRLLKDAELEHDEPGDIDAATLDEVVERVRASYGAKAEEQLRQATDAYELRLSESEERAQADRRRAEAAEHSAAERIRRQELAIDARARNWAQGVSQGGQWLVVILVAAGAVALIIGHPLHSGWLGIVLGSAVVIFITLEVVGILRHVSELRASFEVRLATRLRGWLSVGVPSKNEPPAE